MMRSLHAIDQVWRQAGTHGGKTRLARLLPLPPSGDYPTPLRCTTSPTSRASIVAADILYKTPVNRPSRAFVYRKHTSAPLASAPLAQLKGPTGSHGPQR